MKRNLTVRNFKSFELKITRRAIRLYNPHYFPDGREKKKKPNLYGFYSISLFSLQFSPPRQLFSLFLMTHTGILFFFSPLAPFVVTSHYLIRLPLSRSFFLSPRSRGGAKRFCSIL